MHEYGEVGQVVVQAKIERLDGGAEFLSFLHVGGPSVEVCQVESQVFVDDDDIHKSPFETGFHFPCRAQLVSYPNASSASGSVFAVNGTESSIHRSSQEEDDRNTCQGEKEGFDWWESRHQSVTGLVFGGNRMKHYITLFVCGVLFLTGCLSEPKIDWQSRVGSYTYDQAITELGVPDRSATLSDGQVVGEWLTSRGAEYGTSRGGPFRGFAIQTYDVSRFPDEYMSLTFGTDHKLLKFKKIIR